MSRKEKALSYKTHGLVGTLLIKQLLELLAMFTGKGRQGKRSRKNGVIALVAMIICLLVLAGFSFSMSKLLCSAALALGQPWVFFAMMGIGTLLMGIVGTVFMTYSAVYMAKDNDILLAMPMPPRYILGTRILGCFLLAVVFEWLLWIPCIVTYTMQAGFSASAFLAQILMLILLPMFTVALSCILAWVIAVVAKRAKHKNFIRIFLSIVFFGIYYVFCFRAYEYIQSMILHMGDIGAGIHKFGYPIYLLGKACEGGLLQLLLFTVVAAGAFVLVYLVLARSFFSLATAEKSRSTAADFTKEDLNKIADKPQSLMRTLLNREMKHYLSSATYMLNSSMGTLLMIIGAAALLIKGGDIRQTLAFLPPQYVGWIVLLLCGAVAMVTGLNLLTAPSISVEGPHLWVLQSLPLTPREIIRSKVTFHMLMTAIPAVLLSLGALAAFRPPAVWWIAMPAFTLLYTLTTALLGMVMGLKYPRLDWKEESMAVKQGMAVFMTMILDMVLVLVLGGACYFLHHSFDPMECYTGCMVVLAFLCLYFRKWIRTKADTLFVSF